MTITTGWTCAIGSHDATGHQYVVRIARDDEVVAAEWLMCDNHAEAFMEAIPDATPQAGEQEQP